MTNDHALSRQHAAKSLTHVDWYVWDDINSDAPVIRPATEKEIDNLLPEEGDLVSDPATIIIHGGRVLVDAEGVKSYDTPPKNNSITLIQHHGIMKDNPNFVGFQTEEDLDAVIEALVAARKVVYGT